MSLPSTSSNLATALKVTGAVVGALAVATIGYAAVFDYRRRNDPAFRRKLSESAFPPKSGGGDDPRSQTYPGPLSAAHLQ